jgi:hypothetical protein
MTYYDRVSIAAAVDNPAAGMLALRSPSWRPRPGVLALALACLFFYGLFHLPEASADFRFKKGSFTKSTGAAPVSQSVTGVGFQPKVVIFFSTGQAAVGTDINAMAGYGFATGSANERAIAIAQDDADTSGDPNARQSQTRTIIVLHPDAPELRAEAELTSFDADGFTLNWTTNDASATIIHYVALGGSDITNALASSFTATTGAGTQSVTGVGFQPDFLMFLSIDHTTMDTVLTAAAQASIGFASSPTNQGGIGVALTQRDVTISDTYVRQRTSHAIVELTPAGAEDMLAGLQSFDADGFTINKASSADATVIHYLALKGGQYKVGNFSKSTTAAPVDQSVTGVGFSPLGLILVSKNLTASTAIQPEARISFGASDGITEGATWWHEEDGLDTTDANRRTSTTKVAVHATGIGSTSSILTAEADVKTFDPDGFTLTWTTNNTVAEEILYAAFRAVATTEVDLNSFTAAGYDGGVLLQWETAAETGNLGFHIYRAASREGPYERITASPVPGLGSSAVGARYQYADTGVVNGTTYFYKLEDLEAGGDTEQHGPVSAMPRAGVAPPSSGPALPATSSANGRITYGNPSSTFRVLERGQAHLVVELTTEGFYAEPQADGSVRLSVAGLVEEPEPGAPALPVKRAWVDALAGRKVHVASVRVRDVAAFSGLRPHAAEAPEIVAARNGTARPGRRAQREGAGFRGRGLYPPEAARVVLVGFQGELKKALVEMAPLRWNRAAGELLLARRIELRLQFAGREANEASLGRARGRQHRESASHERRGVLARLRVRDSGLYQVRFEDLFGHRRRALAVAGMRLSRQERNVAFHVEPANGRFGPGSVLYFVSKGAVLNPYEQEAVYELEVGRPGEAMVVDGAAASGDTVGFYWQRVEQEQNRLFAGAAFFERPHLWLWESIFAPSVKRYAFTVEGLTASVESGRLELWLQGVAGPKASDEHRLRLYVNGSLVAEPSWPANAWQHLMVGLPAAVLREGTNELAIENASDPGSSYTAVMLDRFALTYPRIAVARDGVLEGTWSRTGTGEILGLRGSARLVDLTDPDRPRWLTGVELQADGRLRFRGEAGHTYLAASDEALPRPRVQRAFPSRLKSTLNRADYLLIGPEAFLGAVEPLIDLRRSEGLRARAVPIEEIYAEFGFGEARPEALREFLAYAYHHWSAPAPRFVLLVGDGTYDYKDHLGTGVLNQVPPLMVRTTYLWTASDPAYASVNGDDLMPDVAIGRLPASSVEQARAMVEKILAFEASGQSLAGPLVLVADNADVAGDFVADAEEIASTVLAPRPARKIYLSELGIEATRAAIVEAFNQGASLVSYIGHGSIHLWAHENVFDTSRVSALAPQPQQPLLLTLNCMNGYFHFPYFGSLAEELVRVEDRGAIAAFSPSGLSLDGPAHAFHKAVLGELLRGGHRRLGDAVLAAQTAYAETGAMPELLSIYHLFGDPALRLRQ